MTAMKRYLILCTLAATAASRAASPASPPQLIEVQQSQAAAPVVLKAPVPPRHLSEQERMELRRQLRQFNSQRKHS